MRSAGAVLMGVLAGCTSGTDAGPGVSLALAERRTHEIRDINYDVRLDIPVQRTASIAGRVTVTFTLSPDAGNVILDFTASPEHVHAVTANGRAPEHSLRDGHIVIPRQGQLRTGENVVEVDFTAGDGSLNRQGDFLYTLFVPDRASSAIPLFDQPDLKATFQLTLRLPAAWEAVANAPQISVDTAGAKKTVTFAPTRPLPTYLFAFAAGRFDVVTRTRDGRIMQFYHRETDAARVERNLDAIFDLHVTALAWLEHYTGIPYPFDKVGFVAIPSFQYGGMEHPGAVLYRASSLFLDESPTQNELLRRASLIAHETAHMWFGDLVTMRWFDDVWMKEVFANFMAAKIVNPSFPDIDHELRFYLAHYPSAYGVDRTEGTHPIRQELENLNEAGSLYGAIIYQKAPIVMRNLETLIGQDAMRDGLREYLLSSPYGNASWPDLIAILDARTPEDLRSWSRVWVEESGRPTLRTETQVGADSVISALAVVQSDPHGRHRVWPQVLQVLMGYADSVRTLSTRLADPTEKIADADGMRAPMFTLPGGGGVGYGHMQLDAGSIDGLARRLSDLEVPVERAVAWMSLYEAVLYGEYEPDAFLEALLRAMPTEPDEQVLQQMLGLLRPIYWRFLTPQQRVEIGGGVETRLWQELTRRESPSAKAACYGAFVDVALTDTGVARLRRMWSGVEEVPGVPLSEQRRTNLAEELALRGEPDADSILAVQLDRVTNPDRRARLQFIIPALSANRAVRDSVFQSLRDPANREREPWVLSAVAYLHHPLRADEADQYVMPSLEMLEEIQRTGDIFFPLRWLEATLGGHNTPSIADSVIVFLNGRPDYPARLAGKVLQAADGLFRAAQVVYGWNDGGAAERFGRQIVRR